MAIVTPTDPKPGEFLSVNEAVRVIGVSRRRLYQLMASGRLDYAVTVTGARRIPAAALWQAATPEERGA